MKLLIDLTYINPVRPTGVSIYAERLLRAMQTSCTDVGLSILACENNKTYLEHCFPNVQIVLFDNPLHGSSPLNVLTKKKRERRLNEICREKKIDVYFIPFLTIWTLVPAKFITLAVVHDFQQISLNSRIKNIFFKVFYSRNIKKVHTIVTISNYVKNELLCKFPMLQDRVFTIYNSINYFEPKNIDNALLQKKYILCVNAMEEYKNQVTLVKAFMLIAAQTDVNLIFKARKTDYWAKKIEPVITSNNLRNRIFLIDDNYDVQEMAYLYRNASLFVNPSLMEGFGFTPIEAAVYEIPVITSALTALRETTRNMLCYVENPLDENELANKIMYMLNNPVEQNELQQVSSELTRVYSPVAQAQAFEKLLKEIAQ